MILRCSELPTKGGRMFYLQSYMRQSQKGGFTLAEVLITLGIIGVVAAITLPAVINRTQSKELEVQFKKAYAELNQVAQLFKKDNGVSVSEYISGQNGSKIVPEILKYYKGAKLIDDTTFGSKDEEGNKQSAKYNIYTMNGTKLRLGPCDDIGFFSESGGRIYSFVGDTILSGDDGPVVCVDINGRKSPNKYGYDIQLFYFTTDGYVFPMGMPHKNNPTAASCGDANSANFFITGKENCKSTSNVKNQAACAYYAMQNINPQGEGNYWQDFLGKNK